MNTPGASSERPKWALFLLKTWLRLAEIIRPTETQVTLFWAGVIGFFGALACVLFRYATEAVHELITGFHLGHVATMRQLPGWQRLLIPAIGGVMAGFTLRYASRFVSSSRKSSTDYMEAIALGNGVLSARVSLVKSLSALFSVSTGASIGREGPLVQLSSMIASLIGRVRRIPTVHLRLLVACGAAAGIASAYNAPIAGALFVAEIILRTVAMESFGPLVFSSVVSTLTTRHFLGVAPLYEVATPPLGLISAGEMIPYLALGVVAGVAAPAFLRLLRVSERLFSSLPWPLWARLGLGGAVVGLLAIFYPEVCGNGYSVVNAVLQQHYVWGALAVVLVFKVVATAATFGSGAVGGVFTPTLFIGACLGSLLAGVFGPFWGEGGLPVSDFTLVGMGAFLAATTHAPLMAIIMLFEMTLDYQMILPLMIACVVAHYVSRSIQPQSIYAHALKEKGAGLFRRQLAQMPISVLMRRNPVQVREDAPFSEVAERFVAHHFNHLYVVDEQGRFRGVVSLHDVKGHLNDPHLARLLIAHDLLRPDFPRLRPEGSFIEALQAFTGHPGERLPVVAAGDGRLLGSVSKGDLMLALAQTDAEGDTARTGD